MKRCICGALIIFWAVSGTELSASIIGDNVEFSRYYPPWYSTHNDYYSKGWAVVTDPGMEFVITALDDTWIEQVDISSSIITLNLINNDEELGVITPMTGFALTSLDYGGPITDVTIIQNQIGDVSLSFGADYIDFHFLSNIEVPLSSSETFSMQVTFSPAPEPATVCLIAFGTVLLRRKK